MNIVKAQIEDFVEVWYLLEMLRHDMEKNGWMVRDLHFKEVLQSINNGFTWLCRNESGITMGVILFSEDLPDLNDPRPESQTTLFVRCLAIHPQGRINGAVKEFITFAETYAKARGCTKVCFDAFSKNQITIDDLSSENYEQKGDFLLKSQKVPFFYFEKSLD